MATTIHDFANRRVDFLQNLASHISTASSIEQLLL
jgi:hypothetical protein